MSVKEHSGRRARTLIERLPMDGSMDFYASLMLALPVPRVAMLRRRSMERDERDRYEHS